MTEDHRTTPPPEFLEPPESREATPAESSSQPRSRFRQALQKFKKNVIKKVSKPSKRSRRQTPTVQKADHTGVSSSQNVEDVVSRLHPSNDDKPVTSENPSDCVNQGASGEHTSKALVTPPGAEEIPDPQVVNAGLRDARERTDSVRLLGKRVTSVASAAKDGPNDLDAADNFQTTYLHHSKFSTLSLGILRMYGPFLLVHPYAKMVLGVLSAASKIILAQTERDKSVQSLLDKLEQVYDFMTQDDTLGRISSTRTIAGRIAQQTLECAHFIRDYSENKSFWKRLGKNTVSETDDLISRYNKALDDLMQQFRDQAIRNIADLVRFTSDELGDELDLNSILYAAERD
ncbi:hypothetical protein BDR07DRAFT_1491450 [Suillus spraguei]|nr:hypothetical protein BDR07DRAFT_1491450 [Suillus spraguei]